jgi:hypothetical protein
VGAFASEGEPVCGGAGGANRGADVRLCALRARLLALAAADAAADAAARGARTNAQTDRRTDGAAAAVVPTGAAKCLWMLHDWLRARGSGGPRAPPPLLLIVGEKLIDRQRAATLVAAHRADGGAPLELRDVALLDVHGGAISSCVVWDALLEALNLCAVQPVACRNGGAEQGDQSADQSADGVGAAAVGAAAMGAAAAGGVAAEGTASCVRVLGRSPPMMEFDVCALAVAAPATTAPTAAAGDEWERTRRGFATGLGRFGPADMERLYAFVQGCAAAERTAGCAPAPVALALLTDVLVLSRHDWPSFVGVRWQLLRRMRCAADRHASDRRDSNRRASEHRASEHRASEHRASDRHTLDPRASEEEAERALEVACRCFDERVVLDAHEWAASALEFARWLCAAGEWSRALAVLQTEAAVRADGSAVTTVAACEDSCEESCEGRHAASMAAQRAFLRGICWLRLRQWAEAEGALRVASRAGHRGASRRVRRHFPRQR